MIGVPPPCGAGRFYIMQAEKGVFIDIFLQFCMRDLFAFSC